MKEIWKNVKNYEGYYQVSNLGNVKGLDRKGSDGRCLKGKELTKSTTPTGYRFVTFRKNSKKQQFYIHRLVASAFIGEIPKHKNVNHIDGNKSNNTVENLEIVTFSENTRHAYATGLMNSIFKPVMGWYKESGLFIGIFKSIADASDFTGIRRPDIVGVCKGNHKYCKRTIWRYV